MSDTAFVVMSARYDCPLYVFSTREDAEAEIASQRNPEDYTIVPVSNCMRDS